MDFAKKSGKRWQERCRVIPRLVSLVYEKCLRRKQRFARESSILGECLCSMFLVRQGFLWVAGLFRCVGAVPMPFRRTFVPVILTFTHSTETSLRHPWLRSVSDAAQLAWATPLTHKVLRRPMFLQATGTSRRTCLKIFWRQGTRRVWSS